jgi:hypothetical protein
LRWLFHGNSLSDSKDLLIPFFGKLTQRRGSGRLGALASASQGVTGGKKEDVGGKVAFPAVYTRCGAYSAGQIASAAACGEPHGRWGIEAEIVVRNVVTATGHKLNTLY